MTRRIFVGDVQGCREELERLLEQLSFDPTTDELHPVGDFVNRGPDSLGCLRLLRSLDAEGVLGNHDLHLLGAAAGRRKLRTRDTLDDVLAAPEREELLDWLAAKPFVRAWPDLYLVHAGLHPSWPDPVAALADADPRAPGPEALFATRVRHCDPTGQQPGREDPPPEPPFRPWHDYYDPLEHDGRAVVFGHWAAQGLLLKPKIYGLDSGCVWGGKLTAWVAEEDRVVQVPAARAYARIG